MHNLTLLENEPLARYTSWRIGGPARYFATATSADDLRDLLQWAAGESLPVFILGGGTNILVADGGYPGLVIRNRATQHRIEEHGADIRLWIESGAPTAGTARRLSAQGYGGLVWAEGLPGTIGGAVFGNAGCYGDDMAHDLIRAWVLRDGNVEEWSAAQFEYGYRTSALKRLIGQDQAIPDVILAAEIRLHRDDPARLAAEMAAIAESRKSKTPSGSSCGSVFKNPEGTTSGKLLDQAGLKGTQVGNAIVSEKHANYIVNLGGATASDVLRLTDVMRERVLATFGVELELEVQVVGEQV
ncbi:MAG: UDP-N-acetylmuramate dehydrogenase [Chloroflexi bacterium]|nr:UDP-N-acetylmuramate dehydrogenase [Chloroflexota bacterium]